MKTILLRLIHYLISLGEFLYHLILFVPAQAFAFSKKSRLSIQADSKTLKKVPAHVGFLIVEDDYCIKDVANMIVWAVTLGISYISVYDINGEIKRNSLLLQQSIEVSKDEVIGMEKSSYDIQLYSSSHPVAQLHSGPSKAHQASVRLLCCEDGHKSIVDVASHFSEMVHSGCFKIEDISPHNVDTFFQESLLQCPDPDLCLKFGPVDSLLGYMPWQIRLTEIISLPTHKGISYKSFLSSLIQFGDTSQRFGK